MAFWLLHRVRNQYITIRNDEVSMKCLMLGHFDGHRSTAPPHAGLQLVEKKQHGTDVAAQAYYTAGFAAAGA